MAEMAQIKILLPGIKEEAVSSIESRKSYKNKITFLGAMLNNLGSLSNAIWKAVTSKEALEKKAKRWESMDAEDAEREFYWWLAGAAFLQIGTFSAGYSYQEVVRMQGEDARLDCRSESIMQVVSIPLGRSFLSTASLFLQESLEKYSLVHNPRELLRVTGV